MTITPLFAVFILQIAVNLIDIIVVFVMNIASGDTVSKSRSIGELMDYSVKQPMNLAYRTLAYFAVCVLVFGIWYKKAFAKEETPAGAIKKNVQSLKLKLLCLVAAGVLAQFAVDAALELLRGVSPESFTEYDEMLKSVVGVTASRVSLFASFVAAPIAEELIFRGVILGYSRDYLPDIAAIALNALLFAVYHGNLIQGCYACVLGAVLAYLRIKLGSVIPCMLLHISINTSILFMPKFDKMGTWGVAAGMIAAAAVFSLMIAIVVKERRKKTAPPAQDDTE